MTREEAIKYGKEQLEVFGEGCEHYEFIKMAIKAIEHDPYGDYTEGYFKGYDDGVEQKLEEPCEDVVSINSMVETIATKVTEDTEKFIFETITPYCEEITQREISKKDLERALTQYFSKEPCEDAISREAVLYEFKEMYKATEEWGHNSKDDYIKARADATMATLIEQKLRVEGLPSVQPSRKGHWIDREEYDADRWKCSECGRTEQ